MYLTSIVISSQFWSSLSTEDQESMKKVAMQCAALERQWTLEDAEAIATDPAQQEKLGINSYKEFADEEVEKLTQMVQPLYHKYEDIFTSGLLGSIKVT